MMMLDVLLIMYKYNTPRSELKLRLLEPNWNRMWNRDRYSSNGQE